MPKHVIISKLGGPEVLHYKDYNLPNEIKNYDEAFLTGTAAEITPIRSIDNVNYTTGDNTTTYKFMSNFSELVNQSS